MNYVGIDYHKKFSQVSVLDERGKEVLKSRIQNNRAELAALFDQLDGPCVAVLEATRNWIRLHDMLEEFAEVKLAHPLKVKAIAWAKVKTDSVDSRTLADLLRADLIPEAHVPSRDVRVCREVLRQRMFFIKVRTMVKNRIHTLIDRHHTHDRMAHSFSDLFGKAGLRWLDQAKLPERERRLLDEDLVLIRCLNDLIKSTDVWIKEISAGNEEIELIRSIPGIGPFFSALLWCEIDGVGRFPSPQKLHAYAGLVPSTYQSSDRVRHGGLNKSGNKYIRFAMIEAVIPAINSDPGLRELYLYHRAAKGSNSAKVIVARRLLTIVYRVLKDKRAYRQEKVHSRRPWKKPAASACV